MTVVLQRTVDIGMVCNGLIAGLVAITRRLGLRGELGGADHRPRRRPDRRPGIMLIDKKLDDPVGVLSAHGLAGIWGTLACGLFTAPRFAQYAGIGNPDGGLVYSGSFPSSATRRSAWSSSSRSCSRSASITWYAIAKTIGLRVSEEAEIAGLDISEHGMYGYPEQFIPDAELYGAAVAADPAQRRPRAGAGRVR